MPTVSVIIPAHNASGLINRAIRSVLAQTFHDFELIVVDDGSTDGTPQVVRAISDSRIVYIRQDNQGPSMARNNGIRKSRGEFIAFLDSDDYWLPNKLEIQMNRFKALPTVGLVHSSVILVSPECEILRYDEARLEGNILESLVLGNGIATSSVIVRREVFDRVGMFSPDSGSPIMDPKSIPPTLPHIKRGEDWELWMRVSAAYPVAVSPEPLLVYTVMPGGLSKNILAMRDDTLASMDIALRTYASHLSHLRQRAIAGIYFSAGKGLSSLGDQAGARGELIKAFGHYPYIWGAYLWLLLTFLGNGVNSWGRKLRNWFAGRYARRIVQPFVPNLEGFR